MKTNKQRQEEIDIENSIIKEYREQCILNAEEIQRLRADREKLVRDMGKEIHVRNEHVKKLKTDLEAAKKEVERLKDTIDRHEKMTGVHFSSSGVSGPDIYFEAEKLLDLVKRAKEILETDYSNEGRGIEQWVIDCEAVIKE